MADIQTFFNSLQTSLNRKNGVMLSKLLSLPLTSRSPQIYQLCTGLKTLDLNGICQTQFNDTMVATMVQFTLQAMISVVLDGNYEAAFKHFMTAYNNTIDYFSIREQNMHWFIPVFTRSSNDLRTVALMVTNPLKRNPI